MKKDWFNKLFLKPISNDEIFALGFIFLIGKWFLPMMIIWLIPIQMGLQGVEITNDQALNISNSLIDAWMPPLVKFNEIGLDLSGTIAGYVLNLVLGALPYITIGYALIAVWALLRLAIRMFFKKKAKNNTSSRKRLK